MAEQEYYSAVSQQQLMGIFSGERASGYPKPELYN
jgi:hypothetical protein